MLNVIEDANERRETLKSAFALARKVLVVSVMLGYQSKREQFAAFEDGVRTQRNTFQKYFAQDEFRSYVEKTLDATPSPLPPGSAWCSATRWKSSYSFWLDSRYVGSGACSDGTPRAKPWPRWCRSIANKSTLIG